MQEQSIVQEHLVELSVGETLQVGGCTVTIVAIEGDELCFEIVDDGENGLFEFSPANGDLLAAV